MPKSTFVAAEVPAFELAWAAGLFEGEGTVRINPRTRRNAYHLVASVANTDREVIDFFHRRWGGTVRFASNAGTRRRDAYYWTVAARMAATFLHDIRPYVVTERVREKIRHGLLFQDGKRRSHDARTIEYFEGQWCAYVYMLELNRRGRQSADPELFSRRGDRGPAPWGATPNAGGVRG